MCHVRYCIKYTVAKLWQTGSALSTILLYGHEYSRALAVVVCTQYATLSFRHAIVCPHSCLTQQTCHSFIIDAYLSCDTRRHALLALSYVMLSRTCLTGASFFGHQRERKRTLDMLATVYNVHICDHSPWTLYASKIFQPNLPKYLEFENFQTIDYNICLYSRVSSLNILYYS